MEIIHVPIVDFLETSRKAAYQKGYLYVVVLLARELEAEESYSQLKRGWMSFNDLTNQYFLFIVPAPDHEEDVSHYIAVEGMEWRRIGTPDFVIKNEQVPMLSRYYAPSTNKTEEYRRLEAIENNTNHVTALCEKYHIRWNELPAIMLFSTMQLIEPNPIVIPIVGDNLYKELEALIVKLQTCLEQYRKVRVKAKEVNDKLKKKKEELNRSVVPKRIKRFLKVKTSLKSELECMSEIERKEIVEAVYNRDYKICAKYPQPLRGELNCIIDFYLSDENIECEAEKYCKAANERGKLEHEVSNMIKEQEGVHIELSEAYSTLLDAIKGHEKLRRGERAKKEREKR